MSFAVAISVVRCFRMFV